MLGLKERVVVSSTAGKKRLRKQELVMAPGTAALAPRLCAWIRRGRVKALFCPLKWGG